MSSFLGRLRTFNRKPTLEQTWDSNLNNVDERYNHECQCLFLCGCPKYCDQLFRMSCFSQVPFILTYRWRKISLKVAVCRSRFLLRSFESVLHDIAQVENTFCSMVKNASYKWLRHGLVLSIQYSEYMCCSALGCLAAARLRAYSFSPSCSGDEQQPSDQDSSARGMLPMGAACLCCLALASCFLHS